MEILYIYSERNEIFKEDIQFNFGGKYLFHYDIIQKELTVKENPYYISGFFQPNKNEEIAKVVNVTGIVGQNGAGKTSILRLLRTVLVGGYNGIRQPIIVALINDSDERIIYHFEKFEISKGNYKSHNFKVKKLKIRVDQVRHKGAPNFDVETYPRLQESDIIDVVYFSNIFDGLYEDELSGSKNISANYLVRNDIIRNIENKAIDAGDTKKEVEQFFYEEINRQVEFINNFNDLSVIPFELPDQLVISPKKDLAYAFKSSDPENDSNFDQDRDEVIERISNSWQAAINRAENWKLRAEYSLAFTCLLNFLYEIRNFVSYVDYREVNTLFNEFYINKPIEDYNEKDLLIRIIEILQRKLLKDERSIKCADAIKVFFNTLGEYIDLNKVADERGRMFFLDIKDKAKFKNFYNLYRLCCINLQ